MLLNSYILIIKVICDVARSENIPPPQKKGVLTR